MTGGQPLTAGRTGWRCVVVAQSGVSTATRSGTIPRDRTRKASKVGLAAVVAGAVLALSVGAALVLSTGAALPGKGMTAPAAYPIPVHRLPPTTSAMDQALENGALESQSASSSFAGRSTIVVLRTNGLTARVPDPGPAAESGTVTPATSTSATTPTIVVTDSRGLDVRVPTP